MPDLDPCIEYAPVPPAWDRDLRGHTEPHGKVDDTLFVCSIGTRTSVTRPLSAVVHHVAQPIPVQPTTKLATTVAIPTVSDITLRMTFPVPFLSGAT